MRRLSRKANVLFFAIGIVVFLSVAFIIVNKEDKESEKQYSIALIAENQKLVSTYVDSVSHEQSSLEYQPYDIVLEKGTKIQDIPLTSQQTFTKYLKLEGPDGKETLSSESDQVITHYAYSLLLIGDIQETTNIHTQEKTYQIVNARISYDQIPFVLKDQNHIIIKSQSNDKEKTVELQEFMNALKNIEKRNDMIVWS